GIVPLGDLAEEDVGQEVGREAESRIAGEVVGPDDGAQDGRDVEELARRPLELLVGHGTVGGSEVDGPGDDLPDPPAAPDRLVVEAGGRIDPGVLVEPLRVERVREGRAGAVDQGLGPHRHRQEYPQDNGGGEYRSAHRTAPLWLDSILPSRGYG